MHYMLRKVYFEMNYYNSLIEIWQLADKTIFSLYIFYLHEFNIHIMMKEITIEYRYIDTILSPRYKSSMTRYTCSLS